MEGRHTQDICSPLKRRSICKTVMHISWILRIHMTTHLPLHMTYTKQPQWITLAASFIRRKHTHKTTWPPPLWKRGIHKTDTPIEVASQRGNVHKQILIPMTHFLMTHPLTHTYFSMTHLHDSLASYDSLCFSVTHCASYDSFTSFMTHLLIDGLLIHYSLLTNPLLIAY